jgi:uncharacterized membrane protein YsdA (DUF1294 family)/cold shock CspA family protein
MRKKGKIAAWNDEKGYGFIKPLDGGPQVFVHIKAFGNRNRRPVVGEVVTYAITKDRQGRLRAEGATLPGDKLQKTPKRRRSAPAIIVALIFFAVIGGSTLLTNLSPLILAAYAVMSFITYVAYAIDKSAAQSGRWRTSEGTLHLFALLGGWPGALVARATLRHKSRKVSFRVSFWATVLINCAALAWLHTEDGQRSLDRLVALEPVSVGGEKVT